MHVRRDRGDEHVLVSGRWPLAEHIVTELAHTSGAAKSGRPALPGNSVKTLRSLTAVAVLAAS
jgi:hypothetical protein